MEKKFNLKHLLLFGQILLLSIVLPFCISAQKFERFSNKEGFNQNTISTITQDTYGFLWFGTPNGLIKYDGYDFIPYTSVSDYETSISNNSITKLFTDSSGILWIGTVEGADVYIPWLEKFYRIPLPRIFSVSCIVANPNGDIWLVGKKQLYACRVINAEKGIFEISKNLLEAHPAITSANDILFIDKTSLLLSTEQNLYHVAIGVNAQQESSTIKTLTAISSLEGSEVTAIQRIQNIYWIGTRNKLFKAILEGNKMHLIKSFENISDEESELGIKTIFEDASGIVWIGTETKGVLKYLPQTDEFINYPFDPKNKWSLSSRYINVIFQDNFDVLWFGTAQGGISKLDLSHKQFITYSNNPYNELSISDNLINTILEDKRGRLWLAGYNGSLSRSIEVVNDNNLQQLQFENLEDEIDLEEGDLIRYIFEDDRGFIWFGTEFSIIVYIPDRDEFRKITLKDKEKDIINRECRYIVQLDEGQILLGGYHIVILKNPWDKIQKEGKPEINTHAVLNLDSTRVHAILKNTYGEWWIGTKSGLFKLALDDAQKSIALQQITIDGEAVKLSNLNVFSLYEDQQRNIWIGTFGGGLNKITLDSEGGAQKIEYLRKNNKLPDDAVYGILPEGEAHLWISTDMGLVRFPLDGSEIDIFDVRDGLAQNNFRQGAYFLGRSGYYYFGGLNGLTIFKPEDIKLNKQAPEILITDLLINNKPVRIGMQLDNDIILKKSISETESITVKQKQRIIGFNIAVQHTSMPFKNKVAYKLEGFNEEWVEENMGKTTITYTNLSAGNYTLLVKGANGDGKWSENITSLQLKILPPWYQTWWSYVLFGLSIIAIGTGIVIYFSQHEKLKQRLKYEKLDKERIETINQGKFRYFTNLSHEFRTPLTLIAGPLEYIISNNSDSNNNKFLAIIQKNTRRLLSLVDQLIIFRKAEQGHLNLNLSKNTLGGFIYPVMEAFENYALEKNINFFYKVDSPNEEIIIDVEKTERIIFNLLSNSFKHTPPLGSISIASEMTTLAGQKMMRIDVIDSGKGIPKEDLDNIFERFYQLGNKTTVSGGGIGLAFCKTLVRLLGGEISATSIPNEETRFSVVLPSKSMEEYGISTIGFSEKSFVKDWIPLSSEVIDENLNVAKTTFDHKYSVLVVENEIDVQIFLKNAFSEKYNMIIANNGLEGLKKIKEQEPDVVVSDVMMPEMDGFELCEKIKSDPEMSHIAVLLLTALGNNEAIIKGLEFGADEYISKPFSLKHLELKIERLIENKVRLKEYFSKNSTLPQKDIEISTRDKEFLSSIIEVIEKNIADSHFSVQELASETGVSNSNLYRRLKQLTGQSPNVYLRNFRLQRAAELLNSNEGYNVTEVMYQIGIESKSYFSTSFKKIHGISPSELLKNKENSGVPSEEEKK